MEESRENHYAIQVGPKSNRDCTIICTVDCTVRSDKEIKGIGSDRVPEEL